jgi:hypothetical protein
MIIKLLDSVFKNRWKSNHQTGDSVVRAEYFFRKAVYARYVVPSELCGAVALLVVYLTTLILCGTVTDEKLEDDLKVSGRALTEVLCPNLPGGTDENHEKLT